MKRILPLLAGLLILAKAKAVAAVCPICTVAVAAGVGASRWIGVDDSISGLWVGGLTASMSAWTINWFEGKNWRFPWRGPIVTIGFYALVILPLYFMHLLSRPLSALSRLGVDKLTLGIITGSLLFWAASVWYEELKVRNNGKAHFPYEKIAFPVGSLIIVSLIFYFLTK